MPAVRKGEETWEGERKQRNKTEFSVLEMK
jgi:hypothetical protein